MFRYCLSTLVTLFSLTFALPASAEHWPTLEEYVDDCVLIVFCRTEIQNDEIRYKVMETWKGVYAPELFCHKPEEGYLYTSAWHGNESPASGREVIFFFTPHNHPQWADGRLDHHSTTFVVTNGKLIWASTADWGRREYTLEEFRTKIKERVRSEYARAVKAQVLKAQGR